MSITQTKSIQVAVGATTLAGQITTVGSTEIVISPLNAFVASTANQPYSVAFSFASVRAFILIASQNITLSTNGTSAVQTLAITGSPTGGTFTMTFGGQTTSGIAYNATAATVQTALQALSSIGAGSITCTGGPLPGSSVVCTFAGSLGVASQSTITTSSAGLTGGSTPTASVSSTTTGVAPSQTFSLIANAPFEWDNSGYFTNPFTANVTQFNVSTGTTATTLSGRILTS